MQQNGSSHSWRELGLKCQSAKEYEQAINAYRRAVAESEGDYESWFNLGYCFGEVGEYGEGVHAYQTGLRYNPRIAWAWLNLAWTYKRLNDGPNALVVLQHGTKAMPRHGSLWADLGWAYAELKKYGEAVDAALQAVAVEPGNARAWHCLGHCHQQAGRIDDAIVAYRRASTFDGKDAAVWRRLGECYEAKGDHTARTAALERLIEVCPGDSLAWNALGRSYWEVGDFRGAADSFIQADRCFNEQPLYLTNIGLALAKIGHRTDAVECYRAALKIVPTWPEAMRQLAAVQPTVNEAAQYAEQFLTLTQVRPYADYLNPFELLDYPIRSLADWDDGEVRKRKKRLLAEVGLNDGRIPWLDNHVVEEAGVRQAMDELDSPEGRRCHHLVLTQPALLRFLTHGHLKAFQPANSPLCTDIAWRDEGVQTLVGPAFARQYNRLLAQVVRDGERLLVRALAFRRLPVEDDLLDACYASTYQHLHQLREQIGQRAKSAVADPEAARRLAQGELEKLVRPEVINELPDYFQDMRGEIARAVRGLSITCNNDHDDIDTAISLLGLARKLEVDEATAAKFREDHETLANNLRLATEDDVDLIVGTVPLRIDRKQVVWGSTRLGTKEIIGLRWGVFKKYTNGVRTYCSYLVAVCDEHRAFEVECHERKFLRWGEKEAESQVRFEKVVRACLARLAPVVVERILATIRSGGTVRIGECGLTEKGVSFSTGALLWRQDHLIPWQDAHTTTGAGMVNVYSKHNRKAKKALSLRDTWNAVLLDFIIKIINERGST